MLLIRESWKYPPHRDCVRCLGRGGGGGGGSSGRVEGWGGGMILSCSVSLLSSEISGWCHASVAESRRGLGRPGAPRVRQPSTSSPPSQVTAQLKILQPSGFSFSFFLKGMIPAWNTEVGEHLGRSDLCEGHTVACCLLT